MPVFWDKQTKTIVNNESSEIVRFLNSEFNDFAKHPEVRRCHEPDLSVPCLKIWLTSSAVNLDIGSPGANCCFQVLAAKTQGRYHAADKATSAQFRHDSPLLCRWTCAQRRWRRQLMRSTSGCSRTSTTACTAAGSPPSRTPTKRPSRALYPPPDVSMQSGRFAERMQQIAASKIA